MASFEYIEDELDNNNGQAHFTVFGVGGGGGNAARHRSAGVPVSPRATCRCVRGLRRLSPFHGVARVSVSVGNENLRGNKVKADNKHGRPMVARTSLM